MKEDPKLIEKEKVYNELLKATHILITELEVFEYECKNKQTQLNILEIPLYDSEEIKHLTEKKEEINSKIKQLAQMKYIKL